VLLSKARFVLVLSEWKRFTARATGKSPHMSLADNSLGS
jgi:hypothetical protein